MNTKQQYFKDNVKLVEIEAFSYCNRQCWFCPNSVIDRRSYKLYLSDCAYENIMKDLKSISYEEVISFGRYNEPLSDIIIYEKIARARKALPKAKLHFNTNGDFLDADVLEICDKVGLTSMNIQVYDSKNPIADIKKKLDSLKLVGNMVMNSQFRTEFVAEYKSIKIRIYSRNFHLTGTNRGGIITAIKGEERVSPCLVPEKWICIDYNGSAMPCCNLRSDWKPHQKFVLGNVNSNGIIDIFTAPKAMEFRRLMALEGTKPDPCKQCKFSK